MSAGGKARKETIKKTHQIPFVKAASENSATFHWNSREIRGWGLMIILYTKLGTMATEKKRKQVCKTDYNVSPGYENPGKEIRVKKIVS